MINHIWGCELVKSKQDVSFTIPSPWKFGFWTKTGRNQWIVFSNNGFTNCSPVHGVISFIQSFSQSDKPRPIPLSLSRMPLWYPNTSFCLLLLTLQSLLTQALPSCTGGATVAVLISGLHRGVEERPFSDPINQSITHNYWKPNLSVNVTIWNDRNLLSENLFDVVFRLFVCLAQVLFANRKGPKSLAYDAASHAIQMFGFYLSGPVMWSIWNTVTACYQPVCLWSV